MSPRSQWVFELQHLYHTPTSEVQSLREELAERSKAIDFMFRVGLTLGLSLTPLYTAATYFHRFYMRHSLADYNWHESSMACLFLAAKIEETSRKIADTARMAMAKARGIDPEKHDFSGEQSRRECERWHHNIQLREELLVDALCFEFVVRHPQSDLADLFENWPLERNPDDAEFLEAATWSVANDSFRTPICVLAEANVAAYACFLVAGQVAGLHTVSDFLLLRDQESTGTDRPSDAETAREILKVERRDLDAVMDCMSILRDFYASTPEQAGRYSFVEALTLVPLPGVEAEFFPPWPPSINGHTNGHGPPIAGDQTPQSDGSKTPGAFSISGLSQGTADST